jgi:hypothetical protein
MGRIYSGIMGPVALLTVMVRGWINGGNTATTLFQAWIALLVFSAVGFILGNLAAAIVEESVRGKVAAELAARESRSSESRTA